MGVQKRRLVLPVFQAMLPLVQLLLHALLQRGVPGDLLSGFFPAVVLASHRARLQGASGFDLGLLPSSVDDAQVRPLQSARCSCTMRTARSRTSGENLFDLVIAPSSQVLEPPQKPGRFTGSIQVELAQIFANAIRRALAQAYRPSQASCHLSKLNTYVRSQNVTLGHVQNVLTPFC